MLPALDLLPHDVHTSPLMLRITPSVAGRFDAIIVDGTRDVRRARIVCAEMPESISVPRLVVLAPSALPALMPEWRVSDLLLPAASAAEIETRLRLLSASTAPRPESTTVEYAGVVIDESNFTARVRDRMLDLTYKEFELMHFLTANPGRVFTREQLLAEVWGIDYFGGTRTVDVHIRRLRAKLGDHEALISTVRGVGYGFARAREEGDE